MTRHNVAGLSNPNSFSNQPLPAPDLRSTTVKTCGCFAVVGVLLATLAVAVIVGSVFFVRNELKKREEAARRATEMRVAEEAAQRAAFEKLRAERQEREAREKAEAEQLAVQRQREMEEAREKARIQREELERQQAGQRQAEQAAREAAADEQQLQQLLGHISQGRWRFLTQNPSSYLLPNGGGDSGLSWRVHLLPFLGLKPLYDRFKLNEPWDSEHNQRLLKSMPEVYGKSAAGKTRFRVLLNVDGANAPYALHDEVRDGTNQTGLIYCVGHERAIEWTKPDDLEGQLTADTPSQTLGWRPTTSDAARNDSRFQQSKQVLMCDNRVRRWPGDGTDRHLKAVVTSQGGELICFSDVNSSELSIREIIELPTQKPIDANEAGNELEVAQQRLLALGQALQAFRTSLGKNPTSLPPDSQLSWRVHLLPYIGGSELYKKFNLNEPWNSQNNFSLITEMPQVFQLGSSQGRTRFLLPGSSISNGNSNFKFSHLIDQNLDDPDLTLALFFAASHYSNYWTMPDAPINSQAGNISLALGWNLDQSVPAATLSGKPLLVPARLHGSKVSALTSWFGKEVFSLDSLMAEPKKKLVELPKSLPATPVAGLIALPDAAAVKLDQSGPSTFSEDEKRLKQVALAIHNFESAFRKPPTHIKTSTGHSSGLSWRVHILPYLDQVSLYEKFALDEPWDSPTNMAAAKAMPAVYRPANQADGKTDILTFQGKGAILEAKNWMASCTDGLGNTAMLIQVPEHRCVTWTKPEDIELSETLELENLAGKKPFLAMALGDGAVMPFATKLSNNIFVAMATCQGNELIDGGTIRRLSLHILGRPVCSTMQKPMLESNRLKQIALAMHNYESSMKIFPPGRNSGQNSRIPVEAYCLSWRVHILPYLGYHALYSQFRLNEPWDSWHNKQLINLMPDVFRDEDDSSSSTTTRIQVVSGEGTPFPDIGEAPKQRSITDGPSNTLMTLIAPRSRAVPWTKPADYEVDLANADFKELRTSEGVAFSAFDGSVRRLPPDFDSTILKALITPSGGEVIGDLGR